MVDEMVYIRDIAHRQGDYTMRCAYDDALHYFATGRLSAVCEQAILANIRQVINTLNSWQGGTTDEMGKYLRSFNN